MGAHRRGMCLHLKLRFPQLTRGLLRILSASWSPHLRSEGHEPRELPCYIIFWNFMLPFWRAILLLLAAGSASCDFATPEPIRIWSAVAVLPLALSPVPPIAPNILLQTKDLVA